MGSYSGLVKLGMLIRPSSEDGEQLDITSLEWRRMVRVEDLNWGVCA